MKWLGLAGVGVEPTYSTSRRTHREIARPTGREGDGTGPCVRGCAPRAPRGCWRAAAARDTTGTTTGSVCYPSRERPRNLSTDHSYSIRGFSRFIYGYIRFSRKTARARPCSRPHTRRSLVSASRESGKWLGPPPKRRARRGLSAAGPAVPFPPPWGGRSPPYSPAGSGSVPRPLCLLARRGYLHPSPTALSH